MIMALVLSSMLAFQDGSPKVASRGISFELSPDGRVELTIREQDPATGEKTSKTYKADSIEEFKKLYPDLAREYRVDRFLASPDGGSWWDDRLGSTLTPWLNFWPEPMQKLFAKRTFGVQVGPPDEALSAQLDLGKDEGLLVREVAEGSPAAKAGVRRHDILLRMNGKPVTGGAEFRREVREHLEKGFELEVVRQGKRQTIRVSPEKL